METVAAKDTSVNKPTTFFPELEVWVHAMGEKGILPKDKCMRALTALGQITSVLGPDESKDLREVLANIDGLADRWIIKNHANPETGRTYASRARSILQDYLSYQENPRGFSAKPFKPRAKKADSKEKETDTPLFAEEPVQASPTPPPVAALMEVQPSPLPPVAAPSAASNAAWQVMRNFPLKGKEPFHFRLPEEGLTMEEVCAICCHLITLADGFGMGGSGGGGGDGIDLLAALSRRAYARAAE